MPSDDAISSLIIVRSMGGFYRDGIRCVSGELQSRISWSFCGFKESFAARLVALF